MAKMRISNILVVQAILAFALVVAVRLSKIVPYIFIEPSVGLSTLKFVLIAENNLESLNNGGERGIIEIHPVFHPSGGLRPIKIVPDDFVEPSGRVLIPQDYFSC